MKRLKMWFLGWWLYWKVRWAKPPEEGRQRE